MVNFLGIVYILATFALSFSVINLLFQLSTPHAYVILASYLLIIGIESYIKYLLRKETEVVNPLHLVKKEKENE